MYTPVIPPWEATTLGTTLVYTTLGGYHSMYHPGIYHPRETTTLCTTLGVHHC